MESNGIDMWNVNHLPKKLRTENLAWRANIPNDRQLQLSDLDILKPHLIAVVL